MAIRPLDVDRRNRRNHVDFIEIRTEPSKEPVRNQRIALVPSRFRCRFRCKIKKTLIGSGGSGREGPGGPVSEGLLIMSPSNVTFPTSRHFAFSPRMSILSLSKANLMGSF